MKKLSEKIKELYNKWKIIKYFLWKKLSKQHKEKISKSMEIAHKEKRAYNIWMVR